jgi:large subunit ribosomal protein L17
MRHQTNKVKFKDGQDANTMLMRKLMFNFLRYSHIKTTEAKGKALKMYMERLISKTKEKTEANKNYVLQFFQEKTVLNVLFDQIGPAVSKINGGFVKLVRLNPRKNDATMMVELRWAHPVVVDWGDKKAEVKEKKEAKSVKSKKSSEVTEEKAK